MERLWNITVQGETKTWGFQFVGDDKYLDKWRADGLKIDIVLWALRDDPVKNPAHYQHGGIETIDIIRTMLTPEEFIGYCKGNIIKYRERAQFKGNSEQDYAKAKWYYEKMQED